MTYNERDPVRGEAGGHRSRPEQRRWQMQPTLPGAEERQLLSTFTVTSVEDSAPASTSRREHLTRFDGPSSRADAATSARVRSKIELGSSPATITH